MTTILYAIVAAHPFSLSLFFSDSLIHSSTIVLMCECTLTQMHTHTLMVLSLLPSVYKLQQSHPSKPVDHEIRLRRKAVNDTGVDTNENIRMKKYRSKMADTVVVMGRFRIVFHSFLLHFI